MSAITSSLPLEPARASALEAPPLLEQAPSLLEYRSEADPDAEFIPKTVAGFAGGAFAMGLTLVVGELYYSSLQPGAAGAGFDFGTAFAIRMAFMIGILGVSTSLLLVGLKVRSDHYDAPLYAKHWLNSIGTGAAFAFLVWGPWFLHSNSFLINRFLAAAVWMLIMAFPVIAAKWTIGPHTELPRPAQTSS